MGEGVEEDWGDSATEGCGSTLNSFGMAERAGLRGVRDGGWDGLDRRDGLYITSSKAAGTESHHVGKGQTEETGTFVECDKVCGNEFGSVDKTFTKQR